MPVTAAEILPYIIDAARSEGYVGLMVILARTAEARTLHEELVRDWTSIHDVTGQRIAVLCPDPEYVLTESDKQGYYTGVETAVTRYWSGLTLDTARQDLPQIRLVTPRAPHGRLVPRLTYPPEVQQAAWTEAVTRCAAYFGLGEDRLPAVLVVCLHSDRDVLIQLRPDTSIYRLCKAIASQPGYEPGDEILRRERDRLSESVRCPPLGYGQHARVPDEDPPRTMDRLLGIGKVSAQFQGLRKHLSMVAHVDADLDLAWRRELDALTGSDADHEVALSLLSEMAETVSSHPRRTEFLRLDKKARKVERAVRVAANPPLQWRYFPETPAARAAREAELARQRAELAEVEQVLSLNPRINSAGELCVFGC